MKTRPLSWSAISSFEYDPDQWYKRYILGEKEKGSKEMEFGKLVGQKLAFEPTFLPEVPRLPIFEHRLLTNYNGIPLVGYIDSLSLDHRILYEYKTSKTPWTQRKVDLHGQITFYALMLYLLENINPEHMEFTLFSLTTEDILKDIKDKDSTMCLVEPLELRTFQTRRTVRDLLIFCGRIESVHREMQQYVRQCQ